VMAVFFAWSRESRSDGGLGWLETARRANFATLVNSHTEPNAGPGTTATARATPSSDTENVDDDEHLAAYNAYLARLNKPR
jgi:hypothetical protein